LNTYDEERNKRKPILITDSDKYVKFDKQKMAMAQEHLMNLTEESILESSGLKTK